jgi:ABC-2 type transport system ATP-binding protein
VTPGHPGERAPTAIETQALSKHFGGRAAVDGIDLRVPHGAVFGFLGPKGSGKTTTIRMLLGLAAPSHGQMRVLGQEMPAALSTVLPRVGALVEGPAFYPFLSGAANLARLDSADRHAPGATRRTRVAAALDRVGLTAAGNKKVHAYSLGMKQRLGIANALLSPRELLVLDEPTNGLDPQGTREVRNLVHSLADEGTTVFVSSHLLSEVEQMCTHAAVMSAGHLVAQGTLDELRNVGTRHVRLRTPDAALAIQTLADLGLEPAPFPPGTTTDGEPVRAALPGTGTAALPEDIVAALVARGVRIREFRVEDSSLEERFVALTGEGFDVAG